jgi:DMSO reductase anchor subunit
MFITNQNKTERIVRFIISLFLLPTPLILGQSNYSIVLCVLGSILLFNSIVGTCMIYKIFGVDTCRVK